jgi:hypothetical protein
MTQGQGAIYGNLYGQSQGMSNYFNNNAAGYGQRVNLIGDQSQLGAAQNYYQQMMQGDGGYAQKQYQQSQDQAIAAQMAMANSARGGAAAITSAQRAATQNVGAQAASAANQSAQLALQEQQMGAQGMQGIGQLELQRASNNAQLQQNNQQQINQMKQALYGMGEQEQGLSLSEQQAYMANLLAAEGINTQQSQFNTQLGMQAAGAGMSALGAIGGAAVSDENMKMEIQPQGAGGLSSMYGPSTATSAAANSSYTHALTPATMGAQAPDANKAAAEGAGMGAATGAIGGIGGGLGGMAAGAAAGAAKGAGSSGLTSFQQAPDRINSPDATLKREASVGGQAALGAGTGALGGAALGPIGAGVGAIAGGAVGLIKGLMT